ncbi:4999_t:CDS:1, partial [Gigaspora rosea]
TSNIDVKDSTSYASESNNPLDSVNLDDQDNENQFDDDEKIVEPDNEEDLHGEFEENEKLQSKKRKGDITKTQKEK